MSRGSVLIVIPCSSLNDYVLECLRGCLRLGYEEYQIVLLPDRPVALPAEFEDHRVRVCETGEMTIAAKRNYALTAFPDRDYYAFIDSDAFPREDWLSRGIACFRDEALWAVGGPNLTPPGEDLRRKVVGNARKSILVSGNMAFAAKVSPTRYCANLHTCNLIVSARAFRAVGGFLESLRTGEDRELCHRFRARGGKILYCSDVVVYHHNRHLGIHSFLHKVVYGYSIFSILKRDARLRNLPLFVPLLGALTLFLAVPLGFLQPACWTGAGAVMLGYLLLVVSEGIRQADSLREAPLTAWAILLSNTGYVLGNLAWLAGVNLDIRRMYRNYSPPEEPSSREGYAS